MRTDSPAGGVAPPAKNNRSREFCLRCPAIALPQERDEVRGLGCLLSPNLLKVVGHNPSSFLLLLYILLKLIRMSKIAYNPLLKSRAEPDIL